jgi:hypothetical protein
MHERMMRRLLLWHTDTSFAARLDEVSDFTYQWFVAVFGGYAVEARPQRVLVGEKSAISRPQYVDPGVFDAAALKADEVESLQPRAHAATVVEIHGVIRHWPSPQNLSQRLIFVDAMPPAKDFAEPERDLESVAAGTTQWAHRRVGFFHMQWLAEITFEHVAFEAFRIILDAINAIDSAELLRHLPDDFEETSLASRWLVFDRLSDSKLK